MSIPTLHVLRDGESSPGRWTAGMLLFCATALFLVACAGFYLQFVAAERHAAQAGVDRVRGASLHGTIMHLDEVLTMSARMAAVTGDRQWEARYRQFEPKLDAAIKEAVALESSVGSIPSSARTDEANQKLVDFENRAFALVASNELEQARAILFGSEYERQKRVYADGMSAMLNRLQANLASAADRRELSTHLVLMSGTVVLVVSFLLCVLIIGRLRVSQVRLTHAIHEREQAHEIARQHQVRLQAIFDHTPASMYLKDTSGRLIARNRRAEELAANSEAGWDGCAEGLRAPDQKVLESGMPVEREESVNLPNGSSLTLWCIRFPLVDDERRVTAICGIALDITKRKQAETELQLIQRQLVEASRHAGMAEVATGVLHNVGNVLNSVNVSVNLAIDRLRQLRLPSLTNVAELLAGHQEDLASYLGQENQGRKIPSFLLKLARHLTEEQESLIRELNGLKSNVDHIKQIVSMQQSYARISGAMEPLLVPELFEDALRVSAAALAQRQVEVVREFEPVPPILVDRHKTLQILVNLISNAKQALDARPDGRRLTLRISLAAANRVRIEVKDNGEGIPEANLNRIFNHGFTTKKTGHGFGLHSGANAAKEMGGSLTVHSDGAGHGATFILELPAAEASQKGTEARRAA